MLHNVFQHTGTALLAAFAFIEKVASFSIKMRSSVIVRSDNSLCFNITPITDFTSFFAVKSFNFYKHHQYISKNHANLILCSKKLKLNNNAGQILTIISKTEQALLISVPLPVHAKDPCTLRLDYIRYASVLVDGVFQFCPLILQILQLPEIHMYLPGK